MGALMLKRYRQLDDAPTDVSVHTHALQNLRLDPQGRDASRRMRTTASAFYTPAFGMFSFSYSEDTTLTATEDSPNIWLPIPIAKTAKAGIAPRRSSCRIAVPTRADPLPLRAGDLHLGLAVPGCDLMTFADKVMDQRGQQLIDGLRSFDTDHPLHMAAARLVVDMAVVDASDPAFLMDAARVQTYLQPIMALVVSGIGAVDGLRHLPCPRDVKRAVDFIEAHLASPITLVDLARVANVPIRTLSGHFNMTFGVSPMVYIATRRLNRAHEALHNGAVHHVTDAALGVGISHLGRFAQAYLRRFGERPSDTLRRSRARASKRRP